MKRTCLYFPPAQEIKGDLNGYFRARHCKYNLVTSLKPCATISQEYNLSCWNNLRDGCRTAILKDQRCPQVSVLSGDNHGEQLLRDELGPDEEPNWRRMVACKCCPQEAPGMINGRDILFVGLRIQDKVFINGKAFRIQSNLQLCHCLHIHVFLSSCPKRTLPSVASLNYMPQRHLSQKLCWWLYLLVLL